MNQKLLPVAVAFLVFLPLVLILAVVVLIGLKIGFIGEKDALIAGLSGAVAFLLLALFLQSFFKKAWQKKKSQLDPNIKP